MDFVEPMISSSCASSLALSTVPPPLAGPAAHPGEVQVEVWSAGQADSAASCRTVYPHGVPGTAGGRTG